MISSAKYVHTNLIARDWRALARFYQEVFGCEVVGPERDYQSAELDAGTGLSNVGLRGVHMRLPGNGAEGPTLEIFEYSESAEGLAPAVNRPGFGHIAFAVEDVHAAHAEVLANGGSAVGEVVSMMSAVGTQVTWCYVADPEGNILELQSYA